MTFSNFFLEWKLLHFLFTSLFSNCWLKSASIYADDLGSSRRQAIILAIQTTGWRVLWITYCSPVTVTKCPSIPHNNGYRTTEDHSISCCPDISRSFFSTKIILYTPKSYQTHHSQAGYGIFFFAFKPDLCYTLAIVQLYAISDCTWLRFQGMNLTRKQLSPN